MANTPRNQKVQDADITNGGLILLTNNGNRDNDPILPNIFTRDSNDALEYLKNLQSRRSSDSRQLFQSFANPPPSLGSQPESKSEWDRDKALWDSRAQQKLSPKEEEPEETQQQKYDQESLEYEKSHFDDRIRLIIHKIASNAYRHFSDTQSHAFLCLPIQRYLSVLAKKLLLNRFELLFLEYAFDVTKWNYELKAISEHVHAGFTPYIPLPESEGEEQEKLQAYMLYCGYYAKKSLNELPADNMFATFFYKTSPRFPKNYDQWLKSSNIVSMKINPKVFNGIFRRLNYYDESTENYSLLVEEIIEISPAYNADKSSAKLRKARKQKEGLPKPEPQPYPQHEPEQSYDREHSVELCDYVQVPTMHKKKTSYVDELDPIDYIKRNT